MTDQTQHDSSVADRQVIEAWIQANATGSVRLTEVADSDDDDSWRSMRPHGVARNGYSYFIVNVANHDEMVRAQTELPGLLTRPNNLRVRRWKPSRTEIDGVRAWLRSKDRPVADAQPRITMTAPHPRSGLLMIALSTIDRDYAEDLERATDGLAYVIPSPENYIPLQADAPS
ncbi:hypothetical protein ACWF0M_12720 [Kribbella sp. NPDC055110]